MSLDISNRQVSYRTSDIYDVSCEIHISYFIFQTTLDGTHMECVLFREREREMAHASNVSYIYTHRTCLLYKHICIYTDINIHMDI